MSLQNQPPAPTDEVVLNLEGPSPLLQPYEHFPNPRLKTYTPERQQQQRDWVRMVLTIAVLLLFAWVVIWACFASSATPALWAQTKDMLLIVLPAVTGLLGSVTGFYFGSESRSSRHVDPVTGR